MTFTFRSIDDNELAVSPGKIVCVGRNYLKHIQELDNEVPAESVLFMKPSTAFTQLDNTCEIPTDKGEVHYECELALLITKKLSNAQADKTLTAVGGYGLALDLTLRTLQTTLKNQGLPWEKSKAFDRSCAITKWQLVEQNFSAQHQYQLSINDIIRQKGDTSLMIKNIAQLLAEISQWFTLLPGDVVLTGTPEGVGILTIADKLEFQLDGRRICQSEVVGIKKSFSAKG